MWEKFIYNNWIDEKLDIIEPKFDINQTKEDLFTLKMLNKLYWEGFTYEEVLELNERYFDELWPIISALDYDGISWEEALKMVDGLEDVKDIDKLLIRFLLIYYYKINE